MHTTTPAADILAAAIARGWHVVRSTRPGHTLTIVRGNHAATLAVAFDPITGDVTSAQVNGQPIGAGTWPVARALRLTSPTSLVKAYA